MATSTRPARCAPSRSRAIWPRSRPLPGVRPVRAALGEWPSVRSPVHVDVLHADQPGAIRLGGGQTPACRPGNSLHPPGVRGVEGLVDHRRAAGDVGGEAGSAASPPTTSTPSGTAGGTAAVDHPHGLAAPAKGIHGGETDAPVPKTTCRAALMTPPGPAPAWPGWRRGVHGVGGTRRCGGLSRDGGARAARTRATESVAPPDSARSAPRRPAARRSTGRSRRSSRYRQRQPERGQHPGHDRAPRIRRPGR